MTDEQCMAALAEAFRIEHMKRLRTRRWLAVAAIALIFSLTANVALVNGARFSSSIGGGPDQPAAAFSRGTK